MAEPLRHRQTKEAATDMFSLQPPRHISTLHKDVAAHEAGCEAKRSDAFDHEQGKVATGSATALKRLALGLHVPLDAARIDELLPDAECHRAKQGDGAG